MSDEAQEKSARFWMELAKQSIEEAQLILASRAWGNANLGGKDALASLANEKMQACKIRIQMALDYDKPGYGDEIPF